MRNGADALMRQILSTFGVHGFYWIGALFFFGFAIIYFFQRHYWHEIEVRGNYLIIMMMESFLWSIILYYLMVNIHLVLMNPRGNLLIQQVILAVGAGIYEEMLFRVILIFVITSILGFIFQWKDIAKRWLSMIIAAGIFSSFHFIGDYGDYFSFNIFMIRFIAGIILGALYFFRGFGITAWTHAIYDLIIVTRITIQ